MRRSSENQCRPSGTRSAPPLYPALTCRAIEFRPFRGWILLNLSHDFAQNPILIHTLKRWAKLVRAAGASPRVSSEIELSLFATQALAS